MSLPRLWAHSKVTILTAIVLLSFVFSSFGWRHFNASPEIQILMAAIILGLTYALMIFELVNRNLAAMIGAAASVAAYDCLVQYATMEEILSWEDLETLSLLLGMMIIVNVLAESGLFNYLAIWAYKKADGRFWMLLIIMSFITAFLSAFIDNVSTMLLVSPTLIKLAELEALNPRPLLIIMVLFCNIGGCATPVGDPPNLIIIGSPTASELNIDFSSFTAYCAPGVLLSMAVLLVYLKLEYKSKEAFAESPKAECNQIPMQLEISSDDNSRWVSCAPKHSIRLSVNEMGGQVEEASAIKNKTVLISSLVVISSTVVLFFLQSLPGTNMTLGWVSLFAGLTLLVLCSGTKIKPDKQETDDDIHKDEQEDLFERAINNIEWSTLVFFFSLFIIMEVMTKLGLIGFIGQQIGLLINRLPAGMGRDIGAITIILWCSGIASACIDNVPFTSMMIKVLGSILDFELAGISANNDSSPLNVKSLVYALAFGACYGGNGSLIGASANLVTAGVASRNGYPITFNSYLKFAAMPTIISLIVANIYLVVVFVFLGL